LKIHELKSLADFTHHWARMETVTTERNALADELCRPFRKDRAPFFVSAFSYPAGKVVDLATDWKYSNGANPNWRERLICPITGLNTRLRATIHLIDSHLGLYPDSSVYITEQVTPLFDQLRQRFAGLVGSEYISAKTPHGAVNARGIRHEDLTQLSFPSATFDTVLSFECLEHIPDFGAALRESRRILKPGGRLLFTVPFVPNVHEHIIRARLTPAGTVEHLLEAEYHGDPMQSEGCLCFTHFGWQLIDELNALGFEDAKAIALWSREFGYLGNEHLFFYARVPAENYSSPK
jgi:SAM-dependent methyltransferase